MNIPFALPRPLLTILGAPLIATALFYSSAPAFAQSHAGHGAHSTPANAPASTSANTPANAAQSQSMLADGEVKKVDKAAGKVTVSHGPLKNLGMPAMTMVFRVKEASWLDALQAGMKIRFQAETIDGALTIVRYEAAR